MVVNRQTGDIQDAVFRDLGDILGPSDSLVVNDTRVIPARLLGTRDTGGQCEVLLVKPLGNGLWEAMARPGRKMREGTRVHFSDNFSCEVLETRANGTKIVSFVCEGDFMEAVQQHGHMPLPLYIKREDRLEDRERYQTIYAASPGAAAAPTAGLHFTPELLEKLLTKGVDRTAITLHVGLETFLPVRVEDVRAHQMHTERYSISAEAAHKLNNRPAMGRQVVVGTTCCRTLESAAVKGIQAGDFETDIFIYPGYQFRYVQHMITNFHLPGSTLLMLVSAFAGYDLTMEVYRKAIERKYRFFSYGDAMLIL